MAWSSRLPVAVEIALTPEVAAVHTKRRTVNGIRLYSESTYDTPTLLKPSDIPPLAYEAGKIVMAPGRTGSGDRLPMRGMPIVYAVNPCYDPPCTPPNFNSLTYSLVHGIYDAQYVSRTLADIQNNRSALVAGLRITRDRLAVNLGGKNAQGSDFRVENFNYRTAGIYNNLVGVYNPGGVASFRNIRNGYDLALTFGRPSASPQGSAEHHWLAELMPSAEQVTAAGGSGSWLGTGPLGVYDVRLSNHIGADKGREDPDGPPYPDDDENFYLSYAAYGFMDFYRPGQAGAGNLGGANLTHRVFPFHVGYDAFADRRGSRTTDIAEAITGATFKGRTLAQEFSLIGAGLSAPVYLSPTDTKRMRGDIELTATISATAGSNTIAGKITNMEDWDAKGYWEDSTTITADIRFHTDGTIDAKGEFTGTFANYPTGFARGGYRGNFYGPTDSLEAAGAWAMGPASGRRRAIAGSFGAALVREDGSYGTKVTGGGS